MVFLFIAILIVFLAYLVVPFISMILYRRKWNRFRLIIASMSSYKKLLPGDIFPQEGEQLKLGTFVFYGRLDAIQPDGNIWLNKENLSVEIDLANINIYILTDKTHPRKNIDILYPGEGLSESSLPKLTPLVEGTSFFICGSLYQEQGKLIFHTTKKQPLIVVLYDCPREEVDFKLFWHGRMKNNFWNPAAALSFGFGAFLFLVLMIILLALGNSSLLSVLYLSLSLIPLLILLPPGLLFYFVYRLLWRRTVFNQSLQEFYRLADKELLQKGELFLRIKKRSKKQKAASYWFFKIAAALCLCAGVVINYLIIFYFLLQIIQ